MGNGSFIAQKQICTVLDNSSQSGLSETSDWHLGSATWLGGSKMSIASLPSISERHNLQSSSRKRTGVQVVVRIQVPQIGLAQARLEVPQEQIDGSLLFIIVPAVVDGTAQADQLVAHARGRLPVPALVLEHRRVRA